MKILLIQASGYRENGRLDRRKGRWLLGMTLPYVAALTPGDIQVEIKDDMLEEITFREDCDLVGLTFMSHQAPRAFQLAAGFRRRGTPVVMGGFHATLAPAPAGFPGRAPSAPLPGGETFGPEKPAGAPL